MASKLFDDFIFVRRYVYIYSYLDQHFLREQYL